MRRLNKNDKMIGFVLLMIFVCAFSFGLLIYNVVFAKMGVEEKIGFENAVEASTFNEEDERNRDMNTKALAVESLYGIQCGVYKNYEYAQDAYKELKEYGVPFIVEEGDYFKVLFGIYEEEQCDSIIDILNLKGIDTAKFEITTYIYNGDQAVKYNIDSMILKLIWKMANNGESYVSTESYKKWVEEENKEEGEASAKAKERVKKIPDEITVREGEEILRDFYNEYKSYEN